MKIIDKFIEAVVKEKPNTNWTVEEITIVANAYLQTFVILEKDFLTELKNSNMSEAEAYKKKGDKTRECVYGMLGDYMGKLSEQLDEHYKDFIKERVE